MTNECKLVQVMPFYIPAAVGVFLILYYHYQPETSIYPIYSLMAQLVTCMSIGLGRRVDPTTSDVAVSRQIAEHLL